jgi:predicted LPLAT superfamily acyltransferase/uncharacterized protein (DUF2062 family)
VSKAARGDAAARIFVVIPVFNNRATLKRIVEGALAHDLPVIVVDDGSTDGCGMTVSDLPVELLVHPQNRGKGAALLTGARRVSELGGTHFVSLDADGQLDPADLPKFMEAIARHPAAVICGDRRFFEDDAPGRSAFGRKFSNFWITATTGVKVRDSQCGYRAYPVADFLQLGLRGSRYELEVEALVKSAWAGITIVDVPVAVTYRPEEGLVSSFRPFLDNARISRTYTRLFMRAMFLAPATFRPRSGTVSGIKTLSPLRPVQLIRAVLTESSSPLELGAAAAVGLFLATLPLPGMHTMAVVFAATLLRLNRLLAFSVSHLCAPPVVPAVCLMVGYYVRQGQWLSTFNAETLFREIDQRFIDYLIGTLVVAPVLAIAGGLLTAAIAWSVRRATKDSARSFRRVRGRLAVYGSRWGLGFFRIVLKVGGIWPAYAALWFVVPYYMLFRPSLRRSMVPYLSRRFPREGGLRRFARSAKWLMTFAKTLVEQGAVRVCGKDYFDVSVRNQAALLEIARSEQGIVLLMSHVGPWMVILHYLRIMQRRVHLMIVRELEGLPVLSVEDPEESRRFNMIDTGKSMGGLVEATSALLKGDMVAIMGDRPWGGRTVEARFLGESCRVLRTPYKLARATGSRLVMLLAHRIGYRKFEILWEDLSERAEDARLDEVEIADKQANAYLSHLEEFLKQQPYLWSDFFDFWDTDEPKAEREESVKNGAAPVGART